MDKTLGLYFWTKELRVHTLACHAAIHRHDDSSAAFWARESYRAAREFYRHMRGFDVWWE